jgi:hypothetical protein
LREIPSGEIEFTMKRLQSADQSRSNIFQCATFHLVMPKRSGTWTVDDDRRLLDLKRQGKRVSVIAKEMGRTG